MSPSCSPTSAGRNERRPNKSLESTMICRMWHGITPRSKADAYTTFLEQKAIPDYRSVPGNLSAVVSRTS